MNIAYALSAFPAGVLANKMDRVTILLIGPALLIGADWTLALAPNLAGIGFGVVLWGLHMGFTQGLFATLVADAAPAELRGTACGMFNLVTGISMPVASVIAGLLWDLIGSQATFIAPLSLLFDYYWTSAGATSARCA